MKEGTNDTPLNHAGAPRARGRDSPLSLPPRLARLLDELDRRLDRPLEVERDREGRTVWVFGTLGYRVDEARRRIVACLREGGGRELMPWRVELVAPLGKDLFLRPLVRALGLSPASRQGDLFVAPNVALFMEMWLARRAYLRLRRDARFRALRRSRLPAALGLDRTLLAIALAARPLPQGGALTNVDFSRIWRHEAAFRACARESPRLLPLAFAALAEGRIPPGPDLVHALHRHLRGRGLSAAAWRYLCRHGTRFLRPAWERASRLTDAACLVLEELERAGLPPPPGPWAMQAWVERTLRRPTPLRPYPVPPAVTRIAFDELARSRGTGREELLREELYFVLDWACATAPELDKKQKRAGWRHLLRRADGWARTQAVVAGGPTAWPCALGEIDSGGLVVRPLASPRELAEAGIAFRNCLALLARRCQSGRERFFTVHERASGRPVAVFGLEWCASSQGWHVSGVKGPANRPAPGAIEALAFQVGIAYSDAVQHLAHTGVPIEDLVFPPDPPEG